MCSSIGLLLHPGDVQQKRMVDGLFRLGNSVFIIPNAANLQLGYIVDMINGIALVQLDAMDHPASINTLFGPIAKTSPLCKHCIGSDDQN